MLLYYTYLAKKMLVDLPFKTKVLVEQIFFLVVRERIIDKLEYFLVREHLSKLIK